MMTPKISIIMPVYNAEEFLAETIASLQAQTFGDFEVICVDDGSTDRTGEILRETAEKDGRFRILRQEKAGAGAARNFAFAEAKGEYVIFLDSNVLAQPALLKTLCDAALCHQADISVCNFSRLSKNGKQTQHEAVYTGWLPKGLTVFSYLDCPDYIMRVLNSELANKLYRSAFLREHALRFAEISSEEDVAFTAVSSAAAQRITFVQDSLVQYRAWGDGAGELDNVITAVSTAAEQVRALPQGEAVKNSISGFVTKTLVTVLAQRVRDFAAPDAVAYYKELHEMFNRDEFADITPQVLHNHNLYREFSVVKKHDYETMKRLISRRIIVSVTTYPRRIGTLSTVLQSIYDQTRKADEVVLWLAEEQFPGKEADLPEDLLSLAAEGRLTIRWCDDLKPHKKYFYALQEYTNDLVVTIDDDLLYPRDMLAALYKSYLLYPDAVSTVRAHLIMVSERNEIMPYSTWIQETDTCIYEPCMQLLATGGAGCLYPPNLLRKDLFDKEAIMEHCPWADDLWLKVMELMSDVPVVLARPFEQLHYLPNSQEEALHHLNVRQNYNDIQLGNVSKWLDEKYEPGILIKKLTESDIGVKILGIEAVSRHLDEERKALRRSWSQADHKIKQSNDKARQAENMLKQTQARLRRGEADKAALQESVSIGGQYQKVGQFLKAQKNKSGAGWYFKYFVYLLAWIPEKLLAVMMFYLKNGGKETAKRILRKFRRG